MSTRIGHALVTGASAGLGTEFARQLAERGVTLTLVARRQDALDALAARLPVDAEVLPADLSLGGDVARVAARLTDASTPVDLLVNNAGFGAYGPFVDLPADRHTEMIDVNVRAVAQLAHAALPGMLDRDNGGIINLGSTASFQPDPYGAVYGATKAFVRWLSEALHEEVRGTGVQVMLLAPGFTPTEFQDVADVNLGVLPSAVTTSVETVVRVALDDFARGRAVSVPGWQNKVGMMASDVSPTAISRRVSGIVHHRFAR